MLLHDLPIELWSRNVIISMVNAVGNFLFFDKDTRNKEGKRIAWVLMELDMHQWISHRG